MDKISQETPDLTQENIAKIAVLFPDAVTEAMDADGKVTLAVDFDALRDDLSGEVVDGPRERYQFTWPGKREAKLEARRPIKKTMRPCPEKSKDWDTTENLYIEGDNLEALKIMRETYAGKVKLIYIDPPYNTGHDFVYDDDFSKTRAEYDAESGEYDEEGGRLVANPESNGRFHSDWCSMMYPRLMLARDLLSDDGAIFISIDDNEEQNLLKIGNELFGSGNYVGKLYVQVNPRGRNLDRYIAKTIEPVLIWVKNYTCGNSLNLIPKDSRMLSEYDRKDDKGSYRAIGLRNRNQSFNPQTRPNLYFPLWISPADGSVALEKDEAHSVERLPLAADGTPTCWTWSKSKIQSENNYLFGEPCGNEWRVYRKDYLEEGSAAFTMAKSLQADAEFNNDYGKKRIKELFGSNVMSFPKPPALMNRILEIGSSKDSLVMDFFSGSATMADAVMSLNAADGGKRRFIMVQLPEVVDEATEAGKEGYTTICNVGEERIRRAGEKIRAEVDEASRQLELGAEPKPVPDIGFRVLRVDESCFKDEYAAPGQYEQAALDLFTDNSAEDALPLDLLFQVLPAFRIEYSAKIVEREIGGKACFDVNGGQLIACFDEDVDTVALEAIAKERPLYAVFRDACFSNDAAVANLEELFKTFSPDTIRKVI